MVHPRRSHRVAVIALDGVITFDLGIPQQIFEAAHAAGANDPCYELAFCSVDGRPVKTTTGWLHTEHDLGLLTSADTVVVPGLRNGSALTDGTIESDLKGALIGAARRSRLISICTGAFVLAAAGLLSGRPATTHWGYADRFSRLFPDVDLDPDVLFVDDGDVLTSAGAGAGIDLCLHVIRRDYGSDVANHAARGCVVPPWREGGQSQYIERPLPEPSETSTSAAREWALRNLHRPIGLDDLARQARMSVRTFTRRFRGEAGTSPMGWLLERRVEHARRLLESTDLTVERIAREAGFGTAAALRIRFHARVGVSPTVYRQTFRHAEAATGGDGRRYLGD